MNWVAKRFKIPGLDFLSLQAPFPESVPAMKAPGFSWYLREAENFEGLEESRTKLSGLIHELQGQGYRSERIFWLGFSQGGVMGIDLGLRCDQVLGGIICVSGFCLRPEDYPENLGEAALKQRIIATHGNRDEIVAMDKAEKTYQELKKLGVSLEFHSFSKPHSFELKREIPFLIESLESWITA